MSEQRFRGKVERSGKGGFVKLPFSPDEAWGVKEQHHVTGRIGSCGIRAAVDDSTRTLSLGPAWMRDSFVPVDTEIEMVLEPEGPQAGALADDLQKALDEDPEAKAFFSSLATFYRKGYLRWIDGARKPETRSARIAEMMQLLSQKRKQK